jgi:GT2 family glycosyltransferase
MIRFAILIPIYNRLPVTRQGLKALSEALEAYKTGGNGTCNLEIVVIDDGSTDGSSAWIAENYPDVHLLKGDGNLWWSGAINRGAKYAVEQLHSDVLLLWNDDIAPDPDYFLKVESVFQNNDLSGTVIGSKILGTNGTIWSIGGHFDKWGKYGMYRDPGQQSTGFFECDWLPGMGTFVPASALSVKGIWWDEKDFPQYHGDSDFTLRCKEQGLKIATCLDLVIHNASDNSGAGGHKNLAALWWGLSSIRSNYNFKKRWVFYKRHGVQPSHYWGLAHAYIFFIGSFFKRNIFKIS